MSNSSHRRDPHDRTPQSLFQIALAVTLATASCGCHYCPNNRHVPRPGCGYASESIGWPWISSHPGGRRWPGFVDSGCTDGSCTTGPCDSGQSQAYYPEPVPIEAPDAVEDIATEAPVDAPALLEPFAPVENYPAPPNGETTTPVETTVTPTPVPADSITPSPLFEGHVELNGIEAEPQTQTQLPAFPIAPTPAPEAAPMNEFPPPPAQQRELPPEDPEEVSDNSLFPLRFAPRLFRLREETAAETTRPVAPPITEASWMQGSRLGGHSIPTPTAPATMTTEVRSGHSAP